MNQPSLFDPPPPPPAPPQPTRFQRGMIESAKAARKWTDYEVSQVDHAIDDCACMFEEFTADDIWKRLPDGFPVTKGLAARLNKAANAGLIRATDRTRKSTRDGKHGHGQRLTVWESLS